MSQQASSPKDPDSEREVFRSAGSAVLSWAWFVVAAIILVDLAVQGRDHAALVTAVLVLAITGVVYAAAWRPKIVADSSGIAVINPVRDYHVPWTAVSKVDVVNAVRVHCEPVPGAARGKVLYSWAVQSSPRSTRKASLRREVHDRPRPRLTPRPRALQPPAGTAARGYGQLPEPAKEALERSSVDFTAGRLAERAQHARQAAARAAGQSPADGPSPADRSPSAGGEPGDQAAYAGRPDPWFADAAEDARPAGEQTGAPAGDTPAPGTGRSARNGGPVAGAEPAAQWAWLPIAAMVVPLALLLLVVLV